MAQQRTGRALHAGAATAGQEVRDGRPLTSIASAARAGGAGVWRHPWTQQEEARLHFISGTAAWEWKTVPSTGQLAEHLSPRGPDSCDSLRSANEETHP